jgi:parvulin-like peptidyl-prolyl isomerase
MARLRNLAALGLPILAWVLAGCASDGPDTASKSSVGADQPPRVSRLQQGDSGLPAPPTTTSRPRLPLSQPVPDKVRICARVNGTPILRSELLTEAAQELYTIRETVEPEYSVQREKILKRALQHLIEEEVVYQDAVRKLQKNQSVLDKLREAHRKQFQAQVAKNRERLNGISEADYRKLLLAQGQSLDTVRRQQERRFIVGEYIHSRIFGPIQMIGPQDLQDYYETHKNEFQNVDRVEWEDIFIAVGQKHPTLDHARQFGQELVARLQKGEPFANLTQFDDGDSVTRKGQGYGQRRGEIRPAELEPYLFQMKPGKLGPVVELTTGVHVFRLVKRDYAGQTPFNAEVQKKIREKLQNELADQERRRIVRQLEARTVIEVEPETLRQ